MAHFYTDTTNTRGKSVGACAHKKQGQTTHARGWNCGVKVKAAHYTHTDRDIDAFAIYATSGSSSAGIEKYIGQVTLDKDGRPTFTPAERWQE